MYKLRYWSANWCTPCRMFGPVLNRVKEEKGVEVEKLDFDENEDLALEQEITGLPTVQILDENGNEFNRTVGSYPFEQFCEIIGV